MKGIREIRERIKSINSTSQITRAMQLVAAFNMRRAQEKAKKGRSYALLLAEILASLVEHAQDLKHPLLDEREIKCRGILVISTDRGLCGPLNTNLFRLLLDVEPTAKFVSIGRKAKQFLSRSKRDLIADFTISDRANFSEVRVVVEFMLKAYLEGKIDTLEVLFPRFENTLVQTPHLEPLLPLSNLSKELEKLHKRLERDEYDLSLKEDRDMLLEPEANAILAELPEMFIKQEIYQMILEAKACEHSARMVAMKKATENAKDLVKSLKREYNKARQTLITQELLEIAAATASAQSR